MVTTRPETWKILFGHALSLIDDVLQHGTKNLYWTFGGGTVLMLRHNHRFSKDIDIFVPDPQALGFVTPRLSSHAESLTTDYTEAANFVKLFLPEGEIDFVASPNLTANPYVEQELLGRTVKVETSAEIVAKKFWHRGNTLTARDIFDFALVAEKEPAELDSAGKFLVRHFDTMFEQLETNSSRLKVQFEAIATLEYTPSYEHAVDVMTHWLRRCRDTSVALSRAR
jgi:predicted nucleotidyltransferase component of viral defense system